jgi:hypothetical protein
MRVQTLADNLKATRVLLYKLGNKASKRGALELLLTTGSSKRRGPPLKLGEEEKEKSPANPEPAETKWYSKTDEPKALISIGSPETLDEFLYLALCVHRPEQA